MTAAEWKKIDWRKRNGTIAAQTGRSARHVSEMRGLYGSVFKKPATVDYSLRNAEIARIYEISYSCACRWRHENSNIKHHKYKSRWENKSTVNI